jgi:hypothetical protein
MTGHEDPEGERRCSSSLSLTWVLDGGWWLTPHPGHLTARKETPWPLYRRLSGPQGRYGMKQKNLAHFPILLKCTVWVCQKYITITSHLRQAIDTGFRDFKKTVRSSVSFGLTIRSYRQGARGSPNKHTDKSLPTTQHYQGRLLAVPHTHTHRY